MKKTKTVVYFRRKREGRTDYRLRLRLLKSRLPRLVVRKSNKHTVVQLVEYAPDGDLVKCTTTTAHLAKLGWKRNTGNIPAAYLAGLLLAKRAKELKLNTKAIVDIGLQKHRVGTRLYAAVKGAVDGGMNIVCSEEIFPSAQRLNGEHLKAKADVEAVKKQLE